MTKICCVFNIAPRYRQEIYTLMDAQALSRSDLAFEFLFGDRSAEEIALLDARNLKGFRGYLRNRYRRGGKLVWQSGACRQAFLRRYDAYLLTGNPGIRSNWFIVLWARFRNRPVWLWTHGLRGDESPKELKRNLAYFRLAGHLLLYGQRAYKLLLEQGFPAERMRVIYNSLDYTQQVALRGRIGDSAFIRNYFGNDHPYVVFVGRLTAVKRLDLLLEAVLPLECNVILVGDGPQRPALEQQVARLGLTDRVWFYGESYDQTAIGTLLHHAAACVSPGNVGLTAIHALTFGTPVITHAHAAHQMPEYEAITPDVTGGFFMEGDAATLTAALRPWLTISAADREVVRVEAYASIARHYTPQRQLEVLRDAFGG